jgi:putative ABC transport system permease protein
VSKAEKERGPWEALSMRDLWFDLRVAVRSLSATRATTAAAVLVLALGTGINTAVLAVTYGILLRPLPYPDASRVAVIALRGTEGGDTGVPADQFEEWQRRLRSVEAVGAYSVGEFTLRGLGEPRVVRAGLVRGDFFKVLGTRPVQGRWGDAGAEDWVVLSGRLATLVGGQHARLGEAVTIGQGHYGLTAVMPDSFAFPTGEVTAWLPSSSRTAIGFGGRADARSFRLVARLKPGVTLAQAADDATRVAGELEQARVSADPNAKRTPPRAIVTSLDDVLTGAVRPVLGALSGAALLVLLVACANVASLLVGRASTRAHEVSVRLALGARPWHLVRGVMAESLVVAVAASLVGVLVGLGLVKLFVGLAAGVFPRLDSVSVDLPVLAGSAAIAFLVALACGAAPALRAARGSVAPALRAATTSSRPAQRLRGGLTAAQIGLSIVLLAGAGLAAQTVSRLLDQARGIDTGNVLSLRLVMTDTTTFAATNRVSFVQNLVERVGALPGVRVAGVGSGLPPRVGPLSMGVRVVLDGHATFQTMTLMSVTPGYLRALGARLIRGRLFADADLQATEPVALLSESTARHLSPRQDPVGRPLVFPLPGRVPGQSRRPQVVGIVGDTKYAGLDATSAGAIYVLWPDLPAGVGYLVIKADRDPALVTPAVRRLVRELDPSLPVPEVRTLDDEVLASIADRRLRLVPAAAFGALALVVALVGLSASMTRAVSERRRELAIRGALGSSPSRTLRMILLEGAAVTAAGVVAGLGLAAAMARAVTALLYGVSAFDPVTFGGVAALVGGSAVAVCYLSARRVLRIDLIELLRTE